MRQEIHKMSLEYLVVSRYSIYCKEVLRKKSYNAEGMSKEHRSQLKELPMAKVEAI